MGVTAVLTRGAFEKLLAGLVYIEEQRSNLIEEYFPAPTPQRLLINNLLEAYIQQVDQLTKNIIIKENTGNKIPFVTIYSVVKLGDLDNGHIIKVHVTPPLENTEPDDASVFSPVGMELLLKRVGETVLIRTSGNNVRCRIKSITLPGP